MKPDSKISTLSENHNNPLVFLFGLESSSAFLDGVYFFSLNSAKLPGFYDSLDLYAKFLYIVRGHSKDAIRNKWIKKAYNSLLVGYRRFQLPYLLRNISSFIYTADQSRPHK